MKTTIKRETLEKIILLKKQIASAEEVKYFMTAVCLDAVPGDRKCRLRAVDGFMMVESIFNHESLPEFLENKACMIFNTKALELLLKADKRKQDFDLIIEPKHLKIESAGSTIVLGEIEDKSSNLFPQTDAVKPKKTGKKVEIGVNAELLAALQLALKNGKPCLGLSIKIDLDNTLGAIEVKGIGEFDGDFSDYALVMPMKINKGGK